MLKNRLKKKIGEIPNNWSSLIFPEHLDKPTKKEIVNVLKHYFEGIVVFNFYDSLNWLAVHEDGLLLFEKNNLSFINYLDIAKFEINYDFKSQNFKVETNEIILEYRNAKTIIKTDKFGAVFTLNRVVNFAIKEKYKKTR